ncbi:MAG: restriction endonuclease [Caulobacterales bacterium]
MKIPDYQTLMKPALMATADGADHTLRSLIEAMATTFALSPEDAAALLPSGRQTIIANRVGWAITHLHKCLLLERTARATYRITDRGREVLAENPERVDLRYLSRFPELAKFLNSSSESSGVDASSAVAAATATTTTPDERIDAALREIEDALRQTIIERIMSASPVFFERLVLDLLVAMGYGEPEGSRHLGAPGDGGVDGVINLDRLGLDKVYVQAKRYAEGNRVSRPDIQSFFGALEMYGTTRGVFVTTSSFSTEARNFASGVKSKNIVLIDGEQLAGLLIAHNVAVRSDRQIVVKKLDEDYFED